MDELASKKCVPCNTKDLRPMSEELANELITKKAKLHTKVVLESSLAELGVPAETTTKPSTSVALDGKGSKKAGMSKKQKRKTKLKECQVECIALSGSKVEPLPYSVRMHCLIRQQICSWI